ncbi:MAG: TolC family protein [Dysgonamonadaceae bacterium]|nr:TolC family protein [Dysgonamonadaceae bacterium]
MRRLLYITFSVFLMFAVNGFAQENLTLTDYLVAAKKNSPLFNSYNNQRFSLQIDSLKLKADYGIHVTGLGDASYPLLIHGWGYNGTSITERNLAAVVRISKDLLGKENINTRLTSFSLEIKQLINQSNITIIQLNRLVTDQYITTWSAQQKYNIVQEIVQLLEQEDAVLKKMTQEASFKQTDYLSFKVILQQNILALQQQYADWLNSYATLNYLAGKVDTTLQILQSPPLSKQMAVAFEQSVYAESYKTDSMKLNNEAKIINLEYRPKLSVFLDGGYSSALLTTPYKNFGASAGISITVPIYDGNKRKMSLQQNLLALNTRERYNEFDRNQYQQLTAQIEGQIKQYNQLTTTAKEQLNYAQILIEANFKQLPTGDVKVVDFILSINNYINLKLGLVQYETMLYNLYNSLNNITLQ